MARKSEIRYIQFYTDGSAARQYELKPQPKRKMQQSRPRRQKKIVLHIDFVAVTGILVAAVMLILMVVGTSGLAEANEEVARMESCLAELENENAKLQQTYREGYDLDQIRMEALEMGMIPASRAETVVIQVEEPVEEETPENSFWSFLTGLFA